MRHIMVMNAKGGCGKSTLATNLASYYADCGYGVALADYDPPPAPALATSWTVHSHTWTLQGSVPSALVVHGCSMVAVPHAAADLFVDVLYPAGCRVIILTGGVGRETPPLCSNPFTLSPL